MTKTLLMDEPLENGSRALAQDGIIVHRLQIDKPAAGAKSFSSLQEAACDAWAAAQFVIGGVIQGEEVAKVG